jgi:hypothetical protein
VRALLHALVLLASSPGLASAQDELDDAAAFLRGADDEWILDDRVDTSEMPWNPALRRNPYSPRGALHFGVQLGAAALLGGRLSHRPLGELGLVADLRYWPTQPWRLRVALVLGYQPEERQNLGAGAEITGGGLALSARVFPFAVDLGDWGAIRIGAELGMALLSSADATGAVLGELGFRPFDGVFEINLVVGTYVTPIERRSRNGDQLIPSPDALLGGNVGVLFP